MQANEVDFIKYLLQRAAARASNVVEGRNMSKRFGIPLIALGAALILDISAATAQTRSGGSWGGRNNNNAGQPVYPMNSNPQQQQNYSNPQQPG